MEEAEQLRAKMKISEEELQAIKQKLIELDQSAGDLGDISQELGELEQSLNNAKKELEDITDEELLEISKYKNPP